MQSDLVVDVGHFVGVVGGFFDEVGAAAGGGGRGVEGFFEGAFKDLHYAVCVGVVVDGAAFAGVCGGLLDRQISLRTR